MVVYARNMCLRKTKTQHQKNAPHIKINFQSRSTMYISLENGVLVKSFKNGEGNFSFYVPLVNIAYIEFYYNIDKPDEKANTNSYRSENMVTLYTVINQKLEWKVFNTPDNVKIMKELETYFKTKFNPNQEKTNTVVVNPPPYNIK
jgi:ABC-type sulfate transport system substrate-binding protein